MYSLLAYLILLALLIIALQHVIYKMSRDDAFWIILSVLTILLSLFLFPNSWK